MCLKRVETLCIDICMLPSLSSIFFIRFAACRALCLAVC